MAGTRRGNDRKQQSDAFEAANPFLTRVETELEVVRSDAPFSPDNVGFAPQVQLLDVEELGPLVPQVTQEGAPGEVETFDFWALAPELSTAGAIGTTVGVLLAVDDISDTGGGELFSAGVALGEYGFGVITDDEFEDGPDEDEEGLFALNDDEALAFIFADFLTDGEQQEDFDYPIGGIEIELEFMVLDGAGQIELNLFGDESGEEIGTPEATSGLLSAGDTGSFSADLGGDVMFASLIGVSGSLEVVLTGINVTTNFNGSLSDFGGIGA